MTKLAPLLLLVLISAPAFAFQQPAAVSLSIKVADFSGAPIPAAHLLLISRSTLETFPGAANAGGIFEFTALKPDDYEVRVAARGFAIGSATVSLRKEARETLSVTLKVRGCSGGCVEVLGEDRSKPGILTVRVRDSSGAEIPKAGLLLISLYDLRTWSDSADRHGNGAFVEPVGSYEVMALAPGFGVGSSQTGPVEWSSRTMTLKLNVKSINSSDVIGTPLK